MTDHETEEELVKRFLRYVKVPSQSEANGGVNVPSTESQWDMAHLLQEELNALGMADVSLSDKCVLTGYLPANLPTGAPHVPAVGFCAHMDTVDVSLSPVVKPRRVRYEGGDIVLNEKENIVMRAAEHPELAPYVGQELIVTDGTSVLGADNKAAVANVMTALATLAGDASIPHGDIYVSFVPDEECGLWGSKNMDFTKFPVAYAYTIDCCALGEVVYETFNAGSAAVTIQGVSAHPMSAKGVLVNPTLLAVDFVNLFDRSETPECTEGTEGYIWCQTIRSNPSTAVVELNIRDHDKARYEGRKRLILENIEKLQKREPRARDLHDGGHLREYRGRGDGREPQRHRQPVRGDEPARHHTQDHRDARRHGRVFHLDEGHSDAELFHGRAELSLELRVPADPLAAQIV